MITKCKSILEFIEDKRCVLYTNVDIIQAGK